MESTLKCPNCGFYEFDYNGIQTFNKPVERILDLWTCNDCNSTISVERMEEKRLKLISFIPSLNT